MSTAIAGCLCVKGQNFKGHSYWFHGKRSLFSVCLFVWFYEALSVQDRFSPPRDDFRTRKGKTLGLSEQNRHRCKQKTSFMIRIGSSKKRTTFSWNSECVLAGIVECNVNHVQFSLIISIRVSLEKSAVTSLLRTRNCWITNSHSWLSCMNK